MNYSSLCNKKEQRKIERNEMGVVFRRCYSDMADTTTEGMPSHEASRFAV